MICLEPAKVIINVKHQTSNIKKNKRMSNTVKNILRWVGYFLIAIAGGAAGGAGTQLL
jgi:hypothetical protein